MSVSSVLSSPYGRWSGDDAAVWVPSDVSRICWGVSQWGRRCWMVVSALWARSMGYVWVIGMRGAFLGCFCGVLGGVGRCRLAGWCVVCGRCGIGLVGWPVCGRVGRRYGRSQWLVARIERIGSCLA